MVEGDSKLHVTESDPKLLDLQSVAAEMQRLREENIRLQCLLQEARHTDSGGAVHYRDSHRNERTAKCSYPRLES
jgi:hypothetical protein